MRKTKKLILSIVLTVTVVFSLLYRCGRTTEHFTAPAIIAAVVYLERIPARLTGFKERYAMSDMAACPITYVAGVDAKLTDVMPETTEKARLQIIDVEKKGYRTRHEELNRAGVGCFLGHMKVYRRMLESDADSMVVFEDDSPVDKHMHAKVVALLAKAPSDWDAIFLGHFSSISNPYDDTFDTLQRVFGMHAYIIRRRFAQKMVTDVVKVDRRIDSRVTYMIRQGKIKVYAPRDYNLQQLAQGTEIQTLPVKHQDGTDPYELTEDP
jgi:GR25 family glycosyltransferase involved in LPS biosynthesis